MTDPQPPRTFRRWAIEITGSPLDNHRRFYQGEIERGMPVIFRTRAKAREGLKAWMERSAWTLRGPWASPSGGSRIYRSVRVVPILVTIEGMER